MDNAVGLVRAYLQVNGYFTVTEYPVLEAVSNHGYQMKTDLDVLAVRFPRAGRRILQESRTRFAPDPALGLPAQRPDMLIGEVKEGRARFNENATDPRVQAAALIRFGCCDPDSALSLARRLARQGSANLPNDHRIRTVVFASQSDEQTAAESFISLGHVVRFLQRYLDEHWDALRHAQVKDPALGFLTTLQKALRSSSDAAKPKAS